MFSNATLTSIAMTSPPPAQSYTRLIAVAMFILYLPLLAFARHHLLYHYNNIKSASRRALANGILYTHVAVGFAEAVRWHARASATPTSLPPPNITDVLLLTLQMSSSI